MLTEVISKVRMHVNLTEDICQGTVLAPQGHRAPEGIGGGLSVKELQHSEPCVNLPTADPANTPSDMRVDITHATLRAAETPADLQSV